MSILPVVKAFRTPDPSEVTKDAIIIIARIAESAHDRFIVKSDWKKTLLECQTVLKIVVGRY